MPLNYSKWDQLELSDDSDIEGHPNVDKRSLIRWKQRDIHEKRDARNFKIGQLEAQIKCNTVLLPRIKGITQDLSAKTSPSDALSFYNSFVDQLQTNPSKDCPDGNDPTKIEQTYDGMVLSLLRQVTEEAKKRVAVAGTVESEKDSRLVKELIVEMKMHVQNLGATIAKNKAELETEIKEKNKHITSEDLHEGFESKYVPPPPGPPPLVPKPVEKKKTTVTEIEVLNAGGSSSTAPATKEEEEEEEEEDGLPELTANLEAFSKIPTGEYEKAFEFIQHHRDVYVPGASDALLVAAFTAQSEGKPKYSKQCIHASLLLQYCEKLGKDGVGVFFKKMVSGDKRAMKVFLDDVEQTYEHVVRRVEVTKRERESESKEQIQLVPENPDQQISFNVPDGPPPEELVLEGPGTEDLDIEQVRKALQFRWDVFNNFPVALQEALKAGGLEGVNKVLGDMDVAEAEQVVQSLDMAGILSFAEGGIRDETSKD